MVRHAAVFEHAFGALHAGQVVAPLELCGIVPLRTRDRAVAARAVVLEDCHEGEVLYDVVRLVGCQLLARFAAGVHAQPIGAAAQGQRVAQVRGVDRDAGPHAEPVSGGVGELGPRDTVTAAQYAGQPVAVADFELRLGRGHRLEDAVGDVRLEERRADPPGPEGPDAAVALAEPLAKFVPEPRREVEVAVRGADALRREHAAQHGGLLDDERAHAHARRGDGGRRAGGRAADDQHVGPAVGRPACAAGGREASQQRYEQSFHCLVVFILRPRSARRSRRPGPFGCAACRPP